MNHLPDDATIIITNSPEYLASANKVGTFIQALPLSVDQNDTLIRMLVEHGNLGRRDAFEQGFGVCAAMVRQKDGIFH